ncbi:hypothetical protein GGI04_000398 [Coemansia thaxteri]|nr:hypothetical protein GGI04_000398 [Coemansia thaxteri]KAJ2472033.1 hypothetical protein EV174_005878 [Coemansia sp. RSA 2320]KAJ2473853.1 hypothetical protein GGI02_000531 [Coemansia sp. RSA 2322]
MLRSSVLRSSRIATGARLAQAQGAARRFASHDSNHHDDGHKADSHQQVFEEEGFKSPLWKYTGGAIGVLFLIGMYDDYVERSGRVHPLTLFYASIMTDKAANRRIFSEYQAEVAKQAEFNILQWEDKLDRPTSMDAAVYYKRGAKWGTAVGTSVDMSAAERRTPIKE